MWPSANTNAKCGVPPVRWSRRPSYWRRWPSRMAAGHRSPINTAVLQVATRYRAPSRAAVLQVAYLERAPAEVVDSPVTTCPSVGRMATVRAPATSTPNGPCWSIGTVSTTGARAYRRRAGVSAACGTRGYRHTGPPGASSAIGFRSARCNHRASAPKPTSASSRAMALPANDFERVTHASDHRGSQSTSRESRRDAQAAIAPAVGSRRAQWAPFELHQKAGP